MIWWLLLRVGAMEGLLGRNTSHISFKPPNPKAGDQPGWILLAMRERYFGTKACLVLLCCVHQYLALARRANFEVVLWSSSKKTAKKN